MTDIRHSGILDDFTRTGGTEYPTLPPWFTVPTMYATQISGGALGGPDAPPTPDAAYYSNLAVLGPTMEVWGQQGGNAAASDAWRIGFFTIASIAAGYPAGYEVLPWNSVTSGNSWDTRRYNGDGTYDSIGDPQLTGLIGGGGSYCLVRRNGDVIESWLNSSGDGVTWVLAQTATDTTYVNGPFFLFLGTTGVETGWGCLGGGRITKSRIIRYVSN
jgi:hypothetical protein